MPWKVEADQPADQPRDGAWVLILATRAWSVYGNKPISEGEIKRVIERRAEAR